MDRGALQATVHSVAKSWTQLKRLSTAQHGTDGTKCHDLNFFNVEFQPWIFIGTIDTDTEAPILRPPDTRSQLIWKDPDAGKDWTL